LSLRPEGSIRASRKLRFHVREAETPRLGDFAIASFHLRDLRNDLSE
jgi:hypothetical protein